MFWPWSGHAHIVYSSKCVSTVERSLTVAFTTIATLFIRPVLFEKLVKATDFGVVQFYALLPLLFAQPVLVQ